MVKRFLITRPRHDVHTSYLYDFSKEIIKTIKETKDIHLINLDGLRATRTNFESFIKENPKLIFLNGHGDVKSVSGHKNEVILDERNVDLTKNKIVYALSCDSLEGLGPVAVKRGTKAYIGYKARFMMVIDPSRTSSPNKDNNVLPFRKACCALINSLVFGSTVDKAIERTKREYRRSIRSFGTSEDNPYGDTPLIRFALAWNLEFLDVCGNPKASF